MNTSVTLVFLAAICICQGKPISKRQADDIVGYCPTGWNKWQDKCYILKQSTKQWSSAEFDCNQNGGYLVSVDSSENQEYVNRLLGGRSIRDSFVWIGLSDKTTEGAWRWSDKTQLNYTNWYDTQKQPNGNQTENCAAIEVTSKMWFDRPCGDMHVYICEQKTKPQESLRNCSFETGMCGYTLSQNHYYTWNRQYRGAYGTPNYAAEGRYFMSVSPSSYARSGDKARLISPVYDTQDCDILVQFHRFMYSDDTLNVKLNTQDLKTRTVFTKQGNDPYSWYKETILVSKELGKFRLEFEAIKGASTSTNRATAVDNIRLIKQTSCRGSSFKTCAPPPTIRHGARLYKTSGNNVTYTCNHGLKLRGYGSETHTLYCQRDGTWNIVKTDLVCEANCPSSLQITGSQGVLASPGYPDGYHNNARCSWTIVGLKNHKIGLSFTYFQTEFVHDNLEIYTHPRGTLLERLSGRLALNVILDADSIRLVWTTDSSKTDKGYLLNWRGNYGVRYRFKAHVLPKHNGRGRYLLDVRFNRQQCSQHWSCKSSDGFDFACAFYWQLSTCAVPVTPVHGRVQYSGVDEGDTALYECTSVGYELAGGTHVAICEKSGNWSVPYASCVLKSCPPLVTPENGRVITNTITYGSYASYQCNQYFLLNGNSRRYCQSNATWTGRDPTCEVPDCGPLETPPFGKKIGKDTVFNSIVRFACKFGVETVNGYSGSLKRTCQADGTWSGTPVTCVDPVACDFEKSFCALKQTALTYDFRWTIRHSNGGQHASFYQRRYYYSRNGTGSLATKEFHPTRSCYTLNLKHSISGNGSLVVYKVERVAFGERTETILLNNAPGIGYNWTKSSIEVFTQPYTYLSFIFVAKCLDYCSVNLDNIKLEEWCKVDNTSPLPPETTTAHTPVSKNDVNAGTNVIKPVSSSMFPSLATTGATSSLTPTPAPTDGANVTTAASRCSNLNVEIQTGDGIVATSPGYGGTFSYGTNLSCEWNARHVGGDGYLRLKFTHFDLPPRDSAGQCSDMVDVYSYSAEKSMSARRLCGQEGLKETDFVLAKPIQIRIVFTTDNIDNGTYSGFQAGILGIPQV